MKNNFLDDDWLKEELSDEYIHDDDFSFSVVKKIQLNESQSKKNFYIILTAIIAITSFLFIPDLMIMSLQGSGSFLLLGSVNEQQKLSFTLMEFMGLGVIFLSFILIWSFEDFDLI
tara:strand:+ start:73 stop:420 length:348 start_codon:yes stop_codon:yes gene_type:complete